MRSLIILFLLCALPGSAEPCGAYIARTDGLRFNDALQFAIVRDGTKTTMTIQNKYRGASEEFALLVPVPVILNEGDVKTLDAKVFDAFEGVTAPKLTTMTEVDPCEPPDDRDGVVGAGAPGGAQGKGGVTVESQFVVGEYEVVVLSATDATALDQWLAANKYALPKNLSDRLRPYIEEGSKFFVAKVDPTKVKFVDGRAELSPLRFEYEAPDVRLPIRLSAANSAGVQDVIVYTLRPNEVASSRMEAANRPNVQINGNIEITEEAANAFPAFYATLVAHALAKTPNAVLTEYAGNAFGIEAMTAVGALPTRGWTLTRLHFQVSRDGPLDDLILRDAPNELIFGNFLRKVPWKGPVNCMKPIRGRYKGAATQPEVARRNTQPLATPIDQLVITDWPALDIKSKVPAPKPSPTAKQGCCDGSVGGSTFGLSLLVGMWIVRRRRQ